jgi:hypothetical protein
MTAEEDEDTKLARMRAKIIEGQAAQISKVKADIETWIDEHYQDHSLDVVVMNALLELAFERFIDLHGKKDQGAAELLEIAHQGGAIQRAEKEGISEFAVRKIVVRLGGGGIAKVDLLPWLDNWIEAAQRELGRRTNEDEAFEAARGAQSTKRPLPSIPATSPQTRQHRAASAGYVLKCGRHAAKETAQLAPVRPA